MAGIAGIALVAVTVIGTDSDDAGQATGTVPAAADASARAEAAQRADRSVREPIPVPPSSAAPAPTPSASTSAVISTAPASAGAAPATGTAPTASTAPPASQHRPPASSKAPVSSKAPTTTAAAAKTTAAKATTGWVNPMPGASTTSCYGMRWGAMHAGIDLAMPANTPIHAAAAGTVVEAGWAYSGYGISVVIDHGNGYLTHYAHQNRTAVSVGQHVSAGEVIGYEGSTGDSTGPHLHFEVHNGLWNQIDPAPWMRARGVDLGC